MGLTLTSLSKPFGRLGKSETRSSTTGHENISGAQGTQLICCCHSFWRVFECDKPQSRVLLTTNMAYCLAWLLAASSVLRNRLEIANQLTRNAVVLYTHTHTHTHISQRYVKEKYIVDTCKWTVTTVTMHFFQHYRVLTTIYITFWHHILVFGLCLVYIFKNTLNTTFMKPTLLPSAGKDAPNPVYPLDWAVLSNWVPEKHFNLFGQAPRTVKSRFVTGKEL
jgi:hypothetical protein